MAAAETDYFTKVGNPGTATTLSAPGHTIGGTSITVIATTNWPTTTGAIFAMDTFTLVNGEEVRDVGSYTEWEGIVASSTSITNMVLRYGTDQNYAAGTTSRVYIPVASSRENRLVDGIVVEHNQDGTHDETVITSRTADTAPASGDSILTYDTSATALKKVTLANLFKTPPVTVSTDSANGWISTVLPAPNTVTANGNRSYDIVMNSADYTSYVSPGMRLKLTRTVTAPTQCADLESGSSQYFSKTSPNGLSFTDDFTCMAWVKLESYGATNGIINRRNGSTEGWCFDILSDGRVQIGALRIASNNAFNASYQSIPLGKWVHVAATYDLSAATGLIYIDGVLVPSANTVTGTITALVQGTTALVVGASNSAGGTPFDGKIAQAAVFSSVLSASTIRSYMSQTLSGAESTNVSAFSLNGVLTDLNANANTLTGSGGAVATDTDTPFTNSVTNTSITAGTTNYAIVTKAVFSTNTTLTVQIPEGETIPTSGGISAVSYSTQKAPYGFPVDMGKWEIVVLNKTLATQLTPTTATWYNVGTQYMNVPIGAFNIFYEASTQVGTGAGTSIEISATLSTSSSSESDKDLTSACIGANAATATGAPHRKTKYITTSSATTYYLLQKVIGSSLSNMYFRGDYGTTIISATLAYL